MGLEVRRCRLSGGSVLLFSSTTINVLSNDTDGACAQATVTITILSVLPI
jgi:hypothetical protein